MKRIIPVLCAACLLVSCGGSSVTVTLPSYLKTMTSDSTYPELKNAEKKTTNSDGSVSVEMEEEAQKSLLDRLKKDFEETKSKLVGSSSTPTITSLSANSDFSRITLETSSDSLSLAESAAAVALLSYGEMYGIFSGQENYKYTIECVNEKTGDVLHSLSQADFREMTDKLGELQNKLGA